MSTEQHVTPEQAPQRSAAVDAAGSTTRRWSPLIGEAAAAGRRFGIVFMFAALFVALALSSSSFLTATNLRNILEQNAAVAIMAICTTPVLIAAGIDLSIASIYTLCGIFAAKIALSADPGFGVAVALAVGAALGVANGLVTTGARVNSLIGTLAMSIMLSGVALLVTNGFAVAPSNPNFAEIGTHRVAGTTYGVWIFVVCAILLQFVLSRSTLGRKIYASGGNAEAARIAGIRVGRVLVFVFVVSGAGAALAGVVGASQVAQASPQTDPTLLFGALAAVVIGGTSIMGGEGAIWRTALGIFFLALINNGLDLLGVSPNYQGIVEGAIIMFAVAGDALARRTEQTG